MSDKLNKLDKSEVSDLLWVIEKDNYKEKPVDIETFIEDDEYLGKIYGHGHLFPFWKKLLKKVYPSPFLCPYEEVILSCAIGAGKCVHKDTYISSSAGIKTIEQMFKDGDVGATILTEDGPYPITAIIDNGEKTVRVLKTNKGKTLKATPEHRFRVLTKDLKVEWKHVRDIEIGDNLIVACQEQIHGTEKLPEDYAYFFGAMTGDGCITGGRRKDGTISRTELGFCCGKHVARTEPEFIDYFERIFQKFTGRPDAKWKGKSREEVTDISVASKELAKKMIAEGYCDNEADYNKRIPHVIMKAPAEDIWEYISGLIDTDGYVAPNGEVSIGFKYKELTEGLGILASSLGLRYTLSEKYNKTHKTMGYCLSFTGLETLKKLAENLHLRLSYKAKRLAVNLDREYNRNVRTTYPINPGILKPLREKAVKIHGTYRSRHEEDRFGYKVQGLWGASLSQNKGVTLETLKLIKKYYPEIMQDDQ